MTAPGKPTIKNILKLTKSKNGPGITMYRYLTAQVIPGTLTLIKICFLRYGS